jgi:tRNA(Arg) A34 adenosine deaminase TadA
MSDQDFLREAVKVGEQQAPPRNFGAIIVKDGQIIAAEHNHVYEDHDPSAHAEISALRAACKKLGTHNLDGCVMYASHEPCLMCFSCAAWARIDRLVYATAADDITDYTYEFEGVKLQDLASHLARKPISVEHVALS